MKQDINTRGFTRIEAVCITGISLIALALLAALGWHMLNLMWQGDDAGSVNNAYSIATVNSTAACIVPDCPGVDTAEHKAHTRSNGEMFVYFNKGPNTLTATKPHGYNESSLLEIEGHEQHVAAGTMVIEVKVKNGHVSCTWVEGAQN